MGTSVIDDELIKADDVLPKAMLPSTKAFDRTWNSTKGISFTSATNKTWNSSQAIRFADTGASTHSGGRNGARMLSTITKQNLPSMASGYLRDTSMQASQITEGVLPTDNSFIASEGSPSRPLARGEPHTKSSKTGRTSSSTGKGVEDIVILGKSIIEICKKIEADVGEAVVEDWQNSLTVQPEIYGSDPNRHIYDFISENMTEVTQFTSVYETGKISINRVLRSLSGIQHEIDRLIGENIAVVGEDVPVVESEDALPDRPLLIYRNLRSHIEHTDLNSSDSPTRMPTFWSLARHQKYWDRGMKVQETEQPSAEDSAILSNDTLAELDAKMQALSDLIDLTISAQTCIHESQTNLTPEHISANEKARPYDSTDESYDELDQSIDAVPSRKSQDVGNRPQSSRIDLGLSNPLEHGIRPATDNASMKAFNHMAGTASIDQDDLEKQEGKKAQNIDEAQKPMPLFLPIEVYKTLEDLSTKMKSLTNFLDEMISVQKVPQESREEKNSETSKATNDEETLSSSHQLKNRRARRSQSASVSKRCMQSRFKSVRRLKTPLSGREKKCSDALVEDKGRATEDGIHSLKLKFHYPVTRPFRGDLEYEELEQILNGVELPKHRDSRKGMQEAIREAWLSLEAKSKPYPFLDHELTHKFFMEWLSEPDQQHGLKVDTNNRMSSQSGTGHGLGAVYDEVESEIDNAESKWTSASMGRLNIQASPRLFSPHLSLSEIPDDMEPPYPTLSIPGEEETAMAPSHDGQSIDTYTPERASPLDDEPFCTPLGFHIPQNKLQEALDAPTTSTAAYWQYTLYQGPDGEKDKVKVHYCKSKEASERVAQLFLDEKVLGFDIEWKANAAATEGIAKNVSLIQLASERRIALFHVARYSNTNTLENFAVPTLKKIMESRDITKVGVAVKGDCTRLRKFLNIEPRGIFELSHLYKLVKFSSGDVKKINKVLVSLAQQVQEHLQLPLWKGEVRSSDWSEDLDYQQIQYAASDSYAGFHLYHTLEAKRRATIPTPPRPAYAELNLPIRLANGQTVTTWNDAPAPVEESIPEPVSNLPISVEELARDFMNIQIEDSTAKDTVPESSIRNMDARVARGPRSETPIALSSSSSMSSSSPASAPPPASKPPSSSSKEPPQPCVVRANEWVAHYANSLPPGSKAIAKPADLRAYYLWHHEDYSASQIRRVYHGSVLEMSTVVGYIFNAIRQEDLPFNVGRAWKLAPHGHRFFKKGYMALIFSKTLGRGEETTGREEIENEAEGKGLGEDDKASTEENIREADSDTASGS